jgi:hypothetical protein
MSLLLALQAVGSDRDLTAAGVATATFQAASFAGQPLSSAGVATVTFNAATILARDLSSAGASTVSPISAARVGVLLSAAGIGAAAWQAEDIGTGPPAGPAFPPITGWAGGHHLRRKRTKPIDEVLADIIAEPPGLPTPAERAALKRAARAARQQADDDDTIALLLLSLH